MDSRLPNDPAETARPASDDTGLEELGLPVRARNALRAAGCHTIADVLQLDLATPIRGLGRKAREELFEKLAEAGFSHPADEQRASEITMVERSLQRVEERVDLALAAIAKDVRTARLRLRRLKVS
jgi:DNA-directed RNA polymerase alpha subunit